jgi:hypothetical protein
MHARMLSSCILEELADSAQLFALLFIVPNEKQFSFDQIENTATFTEFLKCSLTHFKSASSVVRH